MPVISSFALQYFNVDFGALSQSGFDLFITDGAPLPRPGSVPAITDSQVASLQAQGRTVVGYVDVAVTEDYRGYWDAAWTSDGTDTGIPTVAAPAWLQGQPANAFGLVADFTDPAWQQLVIAQAVDLVSRGYDGVFLDDTGIYYFLGQGGTWAQTQELANQMALFIADIAAAIRQVNPDAYVVTNVSGRLPQAVTQDAAGAAALDAYFAAVDAHLLENHEAADVDYASQNFRGETLLLLQQDGTAPFGTLAAWQRGILYTTPDYATLGTLAYPLTGGADSFSGGDGPNTLTGLGGADTLDGGAGNDRLLGGSGNDVLTGGSGDDDITGNSNNDSVFGGDGADSVRGGLGLDLVSGGAGNDVVRGDGGADTLAGGAGDDSLIGGAQADVIGGDEGNDSITGGTGRDVLTGGLGADTFVWNVNDFGTDLRAGADRITDFDHTEFDLIDLSQIDASTVAAGNNAFSWIGNAAFSQVAGQLHFVLVGSNTYVEGDRNGDGTADFAIRLDGAMGLVAGDFVL